MDDRDLRDRLRLYVEEAETIEGANEPSEAVSVAQAWQHQHAKVLTLLIVALVAVVVSIIATDILALPAFAIGGVVSIAIGATGLLALMLD